MAVMMFNNPIPPLIRPTGIFEIDGFIVLD